MIEKGTLCYLFKANRDNTMRIYHRTYPDLSCEGDERWNSPRKDIAGCFTKGKWQKRAEKWEFNQGWMLESINGEVEAL